MIDVCIITKLAQDKFFGLLDSMKKYTDMSQFNFLICYTGDKEEEEEEEEEKRKGLQS